MDKLKAEFKKLVPYISMVLIVAFFIVTAYTIVLLLDEDKEKDKAQEVSTSQQTGLLGKQTDKPLPEVDKSLLDPKTYNAMDTLYESMKDVKITEEQFQSTVEKLLTHGLEGLKQHINDGQIEFDTSVELFIWSNLLLTYVYEADWYTQEDLENSQWMTLMTTMGMVETHLEGYEPNNKYRYEIEANHLAAIINSLISPEVQKEIGYTVDEDLTKEIKTYFESEEFGSKFQVVLDTLEKMVQELEQAETENNENTATEDTQETNE